MRALSRYVLSIGLLVSLVGCNPPPLTPDGGSPDGGSPDASLVTDAPAVPPIAWTPCPTRFRDECATLALPLDHAHPEGETIDVFISRRGNGPRQLWLLQGGPGASAESFFGLHDFLTMVDPELEVYTIEHRGVGDSTRLGCSAEETRTPGGNQITNEEWPACQAEVEATWGERLAFFSTTQAAHDLHAAIERTRRPDQEVFVYGGSYGTYWANRYGVLHPDQPTGVILDAPVQPGSELALYDLQFDPLGRRIFSELCPDAAACSEHLGPDPLAFVERTFERLRGGHCSALGVDLATWKVVFGVSLMDYNLRNWLPALLYRLERCSPADMSAIASLFANVFSGGGGGIPRTSNILQVHVLLSELWPRTHLDDAEVVMAGERAIFFQNAVADVFLLQDTWPRYDVDPRAAEYIPGSVPVLTLAGAFDPAAPPALVGYGYRDRLTGPHQTFVEIPYGAHTVLTTGFLADMPACPVQLTRAFLADPTATLPVGCAASVLPPSFDAPTEVSMRFFGTPDLYD